MSRKLPFCIDMRCCTPCISQSGSPSVNSNPQMHAASISKTLKRELVNGKGCKTREEAKQDVLKCIELYCNRRRIHSSIGYNAPCDPERDVA